MAFVFNAKTASYVQRRSPVPEFAWHTTDGLSKNMGSEHMKFEIRSLDPGLYSYPYHFHRNAEELFIVLSGKAMLRTPEGLQEIGEGDTVFFGIGPEGAHQLYNHSEEPCVYLDIRTDRGMDVCEYPDSGKLNILPEQQVFRRADEVDYYEGERNVKAIWGGLGQSPLNAGPEA
jgi:uncharacterized cupin superfamily protein